LVSGKDVILDNEKSYVPFVVNKALSFHKDCILYVNEVNQKHYLPKKMQYDYLRLSIRKWKRPFQKWQKKESIDYLEAVKEYYDLSDMKAKEVINILPKEKLDIIVQRTKKGGMNVDIQRGRYD
jgi:hypothetical protein